MNDTDILTPLVEYFALCKTHDWGQYQMFVLKAQDFIKNQASREQKQNFGGLGGEGGRL